MQIRLTSERDKGIKTIRDFQVENWLLINLKIPDSFDCCTSSLDTGCFTVLVLLYWPVLVAKNKVFHHSDAREMVCAVRHGFLAVTNSWPWRQSFGAVLILDWPYRIWSGAAFIIMPWVSVSWRDYKEQKFRTVIGPQMGGERGGGGASATERVNALYLQHMHNIPWGRGGSGGGREGKGRGGSGRGARNITQKWISFFLKD